MPSRVLDFPVFDADNHMYETPDAFIKYLPAEYDGFIKYVQVNGRTKIAVNNKISDYIPNPTFEVVAAPGAQEQYFKEGNPEGKSRREILGKGIRAHPGYSDPEPRIKLLDELGIDRALIWPTLASLLEERVHDNPRAVHAVVHASNQWMAEHWTFNYENRMFPTPVIHLGIVDEAIQELEWVLDTGRAKSCWFARRRSGASRARARPPCPSSTRSGPRWRRRTSWWGCTRRTAGTSATQRVGRCSATAK